MKTPKGANADKSPKKGKKKKKHGLDPHPFNYFKLFNSSTKPIKNATITPAVGPAGVGAPQVIVGPASPLAVGQYVLVDLHLLWAHVRTVDLRVTYSDNATELMTYGDPPSCLTFVDTMSPAHEGYYTDDD